MEAEGYEEMMSDTTIAKLIEFLKLKGWTSDQIIELLEYLSGKK